jgi:hypothetical protein
MVNASRLMLNECACCRWKGIEKKSSIVRESHLRPKTSSRKAMSLITLGEDKL